MSTLCFAQFYIQEFFAFGGWNKATLKYKTWTWNSNFALFMITLGHVKE